MISFNNLKNEYEQYIHHKIHQGYIEKYRHFVLIFSGLPCLLVGVTFHTLPLSKALTLVENTNLELQIEKRMVEYQMHWYIQHMIFLQRSFNANVGQINSQLFDTEFSVNQFLHYESV